MKAAEKLSRTALRETKKRTACEKNHDAIRKSRKMKLSDEMPGFRRYL